MEDHSVAYFPGFYTAAPQPFVTHAQSTSVLMPGIGNKGLARCVSSISINTGRAAYGTNTPLPMGNGCDKHIQGLLEIRGHSTYTVINLNTA